MDGCENAAECFDRLSEALNSLVVRAEQLCLSRCPYKNRYEECTAEFGCPNQRRASLPELLPVCIADSDLNFTRAPDLPR